MDKPEQVIRLACRGRARDRGRPRIRYGTAFLGEYPATVISATDVGVRLIDEKTGRKRDVLWLDVGRVIG